MPIDMHSHYYGGLIEHLKARRSPPNISIDAQGRQVLNAMTASTLVSAGYTDVPSRLAYLDEAGIHAQLMTFPGALGVDVKTIEPYRGRIKVKLKLANSNELAAQAKSYLEQTVSSRV